MMLVGVEKTGGALLAATGAVGIFWMRSQHLTHPLSIIFGTQSPPHGLVHQLDGSLARVQMHPFGAAAVLTFYALLLGAEAMGIWLNRPWGELLVVVETAAFLPVEVWSLIRHLGSTEMLTLIGNGLILAYATKRYLRRRVQTCPRGHHPGTALRVGHHRGPFETPTRRQFNEEAE